ncbi:hypothetical protein EJV44_04515 [Ancylobacter aquaticus]|nr:hypothetical protein EJV44_04515 [Ancylobacter aquaticus]
MKEFFSPSELIALKLPDMPTTDRAIQLMAERENWRDPAREWSPENTGGTWRRRAGRGGGHEYRYDVLPTRAKRKLLLAQRREGTQDARAAKKAGLQRDALWDWFERLPAARQEKARDRLAALEAVADLIASGRQRDVAMMHIAAEKKVALRTLYNWAELVAGVPRADWLPHLQPRHAGRLTTAEYSEEAWEFFRSNYLTQSERSAAYVYRDLLKIAAEQGWSVPSRKTLERRLAKVDTAQKVFLRKGAEALKRLFPAQERDRSALHALEAVNADGHKCDVFVKWPDGQVSRPILVGFQDIYSGKVLSWRVDRTENLDLVRLAFADLVETYGVPDHVLLDNGRAFASKKITGGIANRFRFKVKAEEPEGIMKALGCQVHWATPYHGQSKPIERAWRDLAHAIGRDVRFEGAWTGNTVEAKPENYGSKAIPLDVFLPVAAERILEHNARLGRASKICGGKLSFDQAFAASYETSLITKPHEAALRKLLLSSELVSVRQESGSVYLDGNRYWAEFLLGERGRKVTLRFDPDALHQPVHVYRPDGAYLGKADCLEAVGFFSTDAARSHARALGDFLKKSKAAAIAGQRLTLAEQAALLPKIEAPEPPDAKVIRPFIATRGNAALAINPANSAEEDQSFWTDFNRSAARLSVVRNEDGAGD